MKRSPDTFVLSPTLGAGLTQSAQAQTMLPRFRELAKSSPPDPRLKRQPGVQ